MTLLASDVMDQSSVILNDVAKALYSYTVQLPLLKKANEALEQLLIVYGIEVQRVKSAVINVAANAVTLTLPTDFLLPIALWERPSGGTDNDWLPMTERDWEPTENVIPITTLGYWAFRNNNINFIGATQAREVRVYYERTLAVITSENSAEDTYLFKPYLAAKTAEYCARYIGMNKIIADEIRVNECDTAEDNLEHIFVGNMQGVRHRRGQYNTKSSYLIR